jgi:putative SOS response-associated peptidase YedK
MIRRRSLTVEPLAGFTNWISTHDPPLMHRADAIAYPSHMCGRYAMTALKEEIIADFGISDQTAIARERSLPADWNIAPTKEIYLIKGDGNQRTLDIASWGLIAPWSKTANDAARSQSMAINARIETVHEKPTFRDSFKVRRCLVPASGYYEWATELGEYPRKQPIFISPKEGHFLAFAGIYNYWKSPEVGRAVDHDSSSSRSTSIGSSSRDSSSSGTSSPASTSIGSSHVENLSTPLQRQSLAIITREAVNELAHVHNRMPLFLPADRWQRWLDRDTPLPEVMDLMRVAEPDQNLRFWPVSSRV